MNDPVGMMLCRISPVNLVNSLYAFLMLIASHESLLVSLCHDITRPSNSLHSEVFKPVPEPLNAPISIKLFSLLFSLSANVITLALLPRQTCRRLAVACLVGEVCSLLSVVDH